VEKKILSGGFFTCLPESIFFPASYIINTSTNQHINTPTQHQHINTANQHINTSTHQHINTSTQSTHQLAHQHDKLTRPIKKFGKLFFCKKRRKI
jgi:hypothetical protein